MRKLKLGTVRELHTSSVAYDGEHGQPLTTEQGQHSSAEWRVGSNGRVPSAPFLMSIHYFRALAIVLIVAGHSLRMSGVTSDTFIDRLMWNFIANGTSIFVFISGFLFHHVFIANFNYRRFVIRKATTILIPYVVLSTLVIVSTYGSPQGATDWLEIAYPLWKLMLTGCAVGAYWYIPFIFTVFLMAPLYVGFARLRPRIQLSIIAVLAIASCLIHRPAWPWCQPESVIQNVIYYMPIFLLGIVCSQNRSVILQLKEYRLVLLMFVILFAGWQSYFFEWPDNFRKAALSITTVDVNLFQKIFLCLYFFILMQRFEQRRNRVVEVIAASSFAIYFLHQFVIEWLRFVPGNLLFRGWVSLPFVVVIVISICLALGYAAKLLLGSRSRFVTGW